MKKLFSLLLVALMGVSILAACGGSSSSAATGSTADYKTIIENSRSDDLRIPIVTSVEEDTEQNLNLIEFMGLDASHMQRFAISTSVIVVQAYSVSIILPAPGHADDIIAALNAFTEAQKKAFDGYLQPQYEIASNAKIETAPTGEIIYVMSENADEVMQFVKDSLAQ